MTTVRRDSFDARHLDWVVLFVDAHSTVEAKEYAVVNAHVVDLVATYKELEVTSTYHSQSSTGCMGH